MALLDEHAVDMYAFPQMQNAECYRVKLSAGDALYIPYFWQHRIQSTAERNIMVNAWFDIHDRKPIYEGGKVIRAFEFSFPTRPAALCCALL